MAYLRETQLGAFLRQVGGIWRSGQSCLPKRDAYAADARAPLMRVSEIAMLVGVKPHVVRYYVRAGLLDPQRSAANGYKEFLSEDVTRLRCIRAARNVGLSVSEISGLLDKVRRGGDLHAEMHQLILRKQTELTVRHDALGQTLGRLRRLRVLCETHDPVCRDLDSLCAALENVEATAPDAPGRPGRLSGRT